MTTILAIGLVAMSLVAFTAIGYGFYMIHKINSYEYRKKEAYRFLKEERRKRIRETEHFKLGMAYRDKYFKQSALNAERQQVDKEEKRYARMVD